MSGEVGWVEWICRWKETIVCLRLIVLFLSLFLFFVSLIVCLFSGVGGTMDDQDPVLSVNDAPRRWFLRVQVAEHNTESDCWVSVFGVVFDLSSLLRVHSGTLTAPLKLFAGKDVSHWFVEGTRKLRMHVHPETGIVSPFCPDGRFTHVPPAYPSAEWDNRFEFPWWSDCSLAVGRLSVSERPIRLVNTLTRQEHIMKVCTEESLEEILCRAISYNAHGGSYTWKYLGRVLDMAKTLDENGVMNELSEFERLSLPEDFYIPALFLYFNDDLTIA